MLIRFSRRVSQVSQKPLDMGLGHKYDERFFKKPPRRKGKQARRFVIQFPDAPMLIQREECDWSQLVQLVKPQIGFPQLGARFLQFAPLRSELAAIRFYLLQQAAKPARLNRGKSR